MLPNPQITELPVHTLDDQFLVECMRVEGGGGYLALRQGLHPGFGARLILCIAAIQSLGHLNSTSSF